MPVSYTHLYYNAVSADQALNYFKALAAATKHKIVLYDLPGVTQTKITYAMVMELIRDVPNMGGIKTADINMIRKLMLTEEVPAQFKILFSGLDMFDVGYAYGVTTNLDGMFTVVPANAKKMYDALRAGDTATGAKCLTNIVHLRDFMLACPRSLMLSLIHISKRENHHHLLVGMDYPRCLHQPLCSGHQLPGRRIA